MSPLGIIRIRNRRLLHSLARHSGASLLDEPLLELQAGLNRSSADDQGVWIERVHHFVEKQTQRVSLYAENVAAKWVALLGASPRTCFAACFGSIWASWWPGYRGRKYGKIVSAIAVNEQSDSRSPTRPQLRSSGRCLRCPRCFDKESTRGPVLRRTLRGPSRRCLRRSLRRRGLCR